MHGAFVRVVCDCSREELGVTLLPTNISYPNLVRRMVAAEGILGSCCWACSTPCARLGPSQALGTTGASALLRVHRRLSLLPRVRSVTRVSTSAKHAAVFIAVLL